MKTLESGLDTLADLYGIQPDWTDIWGTRHPVSEETVRDLLKAMGIAADSPEAVEAAIRDAHERPWRRPVDPVLVVRQADLPARVPLVLPRNLAHEMLEWDFEDEAGTRQTGSFRPVDLGHAESHVIEGETLDRYAFSPPVSPAPGYHKLVFRQHDGVFAAELLLIVAPDQCYMPPALEPADRRVWGTAVQLYSLRSQRNWGMGDFTDLMNLLNWCAREGGGVVGVNPLHLLFPHNPRHCSPYSPSTRMFLNVLYLDVEAIADFAESAAARKLVLAPAFQEKLAALRDSELVDYEAVGTAKMQVLELLFQSFHERHLAKKTARAKAFRDFVARDGELIERIAIFQAIQERFYKEDPMIWGWPVWPEPFRNPDSDAVKDFAIANRERIEFYQYLQWQADEQLHEVGLRSFRLGLPVGLYLDLAVGVDSSGAEVWADQDVYALGASFGAPPDELNQKGQDWGLPPLIPHKLKDTGYRALVETLRRNMRHAGALRLDHIMALMRLYWVPPGSLPDKGAYVLYPFNDVLGILALESQRNQCLIIGEDLGTVPEQVRVAMEQWRILSYKVFYFERQGEGEFCPPEAYQQRALVTLGTHDLPTLAGYWESRDIAVRTELDLYPTKELQQRQVKDRFGERMGILAALERSGLLPQGLHTDPTALPHMTREVTAALHRYLGRTPCKLQVIQLEDVLGQTGQMNLPGTVDEHPNWRRKIGIPLEDLPIDPGVRLTVQGLQEERRPFVSALPVAGVERDLFKGADVPRATYRLQFNKHFTFRHAASLVPYLARLGVSHCYASPLLCARPGSSHGYDITNHKRLNPEVGTREEFEHFAAVLREHGIGLILDLVPNHMGIGKDNPWWMDVLENGPASLHADYFDIDWAPIQEGMAGKVLLPILGDHYGRILEKGELTPRFSAETGAFQLAYHEHAFPINPAAYPLVLGHRLEVLAARLGSSSPAYLEFQSILTAFERLPHHTETDPERREERIREKSIAQQRLAVLGEQYPEVREFILENLEDFQCRPDDPTNRQRLHRLLEAQVYRLANWRVAQDEINYRRFFDINDLAGLRMEDARVFADTHDLVLDLVASRTVTGLRIDHPDGLFDPGAYFDKLQAEAARRLGLPSLTFETPAPHNAHLPLYLAVEKILAPFERLPETWKVHGTTGYDFAAAATGLLVDGDNAREMTRLYERFTERRLDFQDLVYQCKILTMRTSMTSELSVLSFHLNRISRQDLSARDFTLNSLRSALMEVVASFPVYRTYVSADGVSEKDREYIDWAIEWAKRRSTAIDTSIFDYIRRLLLLDIDPATPPAFREQIRAFAMKFQQYTGPVMAKSLEDTSFYIYNRLVALNEVGGEPERFGTGISEFHDLNIERARERPYTLLALSTHDSKRSADVRARLAVLSEVPDLWAKRLQRWTRLTRPFKTEKDGHLMPDRNDEYLFYQSLLGIWPLDPLADPAQSPEAFAALADRVEGYMLKAIREAKVHTSWINPNQGYEDAMSGYIRGVLATGGDNAFLRDFRTFLPEIALPGLVNALSQHLIRLTVPGVPDIYQGNELWDFSLVDPDNRRPVDYDRRRVLLDELAAVYAHPDPRLRRDALAAMLKQPGDGRLKLWATLGALDLRARLPAVFRQGDYIPLQVLGEQAAHAVAYLRQYGADSVLVVVPRLPYLLKSPRSPWPLGERVWKNTRVVLPFGLKSHAWHNVLTGETVAPEVQGIPVSALLGAFPVALLAQQ